MVWHKEDPEIIAEFANVRHRETTSVAPWPPGTTRSTSRRRTGCRGQDRLWKPYYRFEHIGIDPAETSVFATVPRSGSATVGVRFDASQFAAHQGRVPDLDAAATARSATTAGSFRFPSRSDAAGLRDRPRGASPRRALSARWRWRSLFAWRLRPLERPERASDIAVVVHPDVPVDNLTLPELRRILLGDREFWSAGVRVTLLIRAPIARERDVAVQSVCQMTEAQFRQHWIGKVFRAETPSGPKIVYSTEMALDQVSRLPGAISFVPVAQVGRKNVKVLKIDGRSPVRRATRYDRAQGHGTRLRVVHSGLRALALSRNPQLRQQSLKPFLAAQRFEPRRDAHLGHREIVLVVAPSRASRARAPCRRAPCRSPRRPTRARTRAWPASADLCSTASVAALFCRRA